MGGFGSLVARAFYYPSILYNAGANLVLGRSWYNRINDHIILGAIPLPFMTEDLVKENVKGVISLNEDYELKYIYNSEQVWREYGIQSLRLSTMDLFASPTISKIERAITFIKEIKEKDGTVYVHCKAGKTRSTTVVMCYLIQSEDMTPKEAYTFIREKRSQIWLRQPQLECIEKFYKRYVKSKKEH